MMKKILAITLCLVMGVSAAACSSKAAANVEGTLAELLAKIYANAGVESPMTFDSELTADNVAYMLGTADVAYTEGLASEAAIMSIPHSLIIFRTAENADIEAIKTAIKSNIDPRKWICVGVDPENVIVDSLGDLVFVVMSNEAAAYHESFLKLAE